MILSTTIFFGVLGYLIYTSKKEISIEYDASLEIEKENDDLFEDIEDLFI